MDDNDNIELTEHRAILGLPSFAVSLNIQCKVPRDECKVSDSQCKVQDENGSKLFSVSKSMNHEEVWDAFRRAADGYFYEEDDEPHAMTQDPDDALALIYLPEDAVYALIECQCIHKLDGTPLTVTRSLSMVDIRKAFQFADDGYIDEDDKFVITEQGKLWLERFGGSAE